MRVLHVWSVAGRQGAARDRRAVHVVRARLGPRGQLLYFLSDREFAPQISDVEWNFAGNRRTGIFALALRKDVADPFAPESDEVTVGDEKKDEKEDEREGRGRREGREGQGRRQGREGRRRRTTKPVVIDFDGLAARVDARPGGGRQHRRPRRHEASCSSTSTAGAPFYGRDSDRKPALAIYDLEGARGVGAGRRRRRLRPVRRRQEGPRPQTAATADEGATSSGTPSRSRRTRRRVSTTELAVDRVPAEEWAEIFDEVWRRYRDFFYVRNMHGYDWKAIGERYRPLLPHVAHRSDLNYVLGEMVAELNVGHAYIEGGDFEIPARPTVGLPGARFELDAKAGRYRIAKIFRGHNEEEKYRSPAHRGRRRRHGRRLRPRHRRRGAGGRRQPLPPPPAQDPPGDPHGQREAHPRGRPQGHLRADRRARRPSSTSTGSLDNRER